MARIDRFVESWRKQVVQPLRILRRKLKNGIEPFDAVATEKLRTEVKRIELHAERIEQETIEHLATAAALGVPAPSGIAAARANLAAYGKLLGALPEEPVRILIEAFSRPQGTLNSDQNNQA